MRGDIWAFPTLAGKAFARWLGIELERIIGRKIHLSIGADGILESEK